MVVHEWARPAPPHGRNALDEVGSEFRETGSPGDLAAGRHDAAGNGSHLLAAPAVDSLATGEVPEDWDQRQVRRRGG